MATLKKSKPIDEYLPVPRTERELFQTNVDCNLKRAVNDLRKKRGITWQDLIEAYFRRDLDESKEKT